MTDAHRAAPACIARRDFMIAGAAAVCSSGAAAASRSCGGGGNRGLVASRPSTLHRVNRQASRRTSRSPNYTRHLLHRTEVS